MKNITISKECLKCRLCCLYNRNQIDLAPYFSKYEAKLVNRKKLNKTKDGLYQAKVKKSRAKKGFYTCVFLNEKTHKCIIYRKRPLDCITWPFIIGWDRDKSDVYLWISNKSFCPAVKNISKIKKSGIIQNVLNYLKRKRFFEEIQKGERILWPYADYQIKLKKITKIILAK